MNADDPVCVNKKVEPRFLEIMRGVFKHRAEITPQNNGT